MTKAMLLRADYPYNKRQLWMPMDMIKVASRLERLGIESKIVDLNLEELPDDISGYEYVGIGVIGPPYIPKVRELLENIKEQTDKTVLIGGPGIEHLTSQEFKRLFPGSVQIANDAQLYNAIGENLPEGILMPSSYDLPIGKMLDKIPQDILKRYLSSEFSLFVSQGCKYACNFCAAVRTSKGHATQEKFSSVIHEDLDAICSKAKNFGIDTLSAYISSLDLFQSPKKLNDVLKILAQDSAKYGIKFRLRGLSRVDSFLDALKEEQELYETIPASGLNRIGFGIDGTTEDVWRSQHKGIKNLSDADTAYGICNRLAITPEALLVMGFHDRRGRPVDNEYSLNKNVEYAIDRADRYCVEARPHVAKDMVPGNDGWKNPVWSDQKRKLLDEPRYFKNLDYVALASEITHPDTNFRKSVNSAYMRIIDALAPKNMCVTNPLLSYSGDNIEDQKADVFNMLMPFDR